MKTAQEPVSQVGWSGLERPRFSAGLLLEADDLNASVDYTHDVIRLMFRSLFGCGIVCGLNVDAKLSCNNQRVTITISAGLALDGLGNPIHLPRSVSLVYEANCKPLPEQLWVSVCYLEKCSRPKGTSCSSDDEGQLVQTRSAQGFVVKLSAAPLECGCACKTSSTVVPPSQTDGCCQDGEKSTDPAASSGDVPSAPSTEPAVSPACACYDDHNAGVCDCDCACPCVVVGIVQPLSLAGSDGREKDDANAIDRAPRRQIRPVLTGYLPCLLAALPPAPNQPPSTPPAGEP